MNDIDFHILEKQKEVKHALKLKKLVEESVQKLEFILVDPNLNLFKSQDEIEWLIKERNHIQSLLDRSNVN